MRTYSEEERASFQEASRKRYNGRVMDILLGPPIDELIIVAPLDRESYAKFIDDDLRGTQTAYGNLLRARALAPDLAELHKLTSEWATLPEKVHAGLIDEAGGIGWSDVTKLDPEAPPPGLSVEEAKALLASAERRLWSVVSEKHGLSCVMETPLADVWMAARDARDTAVRDRAGVIGAVDIYVLPAVKWSSVPLTGGAGLLDRKPALIQDLHRAYRLMGGDAASVRTKSV